MWTIFIGCVSGRISVTSESSYLRIACKIAYGVNQFLEITHGINQFFGITYGVNQFVGITVVELLIVDWIVNSLNFFTIYASISKAISLSFVTFVSFLCVLIVTGGMKKSIHSNITYVMFGVFLPLP